MYELCFDNGQFFWPPLENYKSMLFRVMNHFVERQETGLVGMEDDGSSIDLQSEDECQSLDDEEEDIDEE